MENTYPCAIKTQDCLMCSCFFLQRDITELKEITFSNIQSVHLYINSALDWGNFTIKFENILENNDFGYGREGSVVVYGEVSEVSNKLIVFRS